MFNIADIGLISPHESIYHQRCKDITEQLKKFDVKAEVSRHTFKDKEYYCLNVDLKGKNARHTISKALGIKPDDVHFIHINLNEDYKLFWVSEYLINRKYITHNGRLCFNREEYIEDNAIKLIRDDNTVVTNIWNNPEDIIIKLVKKS